MSSVQTSRRDERFMEDIKGALKSKNYSVGVSNAHAYFTIATGFDLCCLKCPCVCIVGGCSSMYHTHTS